MSGYESDWPDLPDDPPDFDRLIEDGMEALRHRDANAEYFGATDPEEK